MPADNGGCGHYRVMWPAEILFTSESFPVRIYPPTQDSGLQIRTEMDDQGNEALLDVKVPDDCEAIVIQRPAAPLHPPCIKMLRSRGIAVIIDMDDDMSSVHRDNQAFGAFNEIKVAGGGWNQKGFTIERNLPNSKKWSYKHAAESCKIATLVTTTTKQLQRVYAPHGRGIILDNYVPAAYLSFERPEPEPEFFGWPGQTGVHPDDLFVVGNAAQRLIDEGHRIHIVGTPSQVRKGLRLRQEPPFTGATEVGDWARKISQTLQVGMAPLSNSAFNRSKSRLKPIEMMSVGVPWVASPREEYRKVRAESGVGFLADSPKEWYQHLKQLLTDEVLRKEQAEAGRAYMADQTYEANAWRWAEAWQYAIDLEKSGKVPL